MNLLPHKRTLCLSNLTGSLSRLVSSTTGVKCQCFLFNQCFILGLYFNGGDKTEFECLCRYIFCPFLIPCLCYVNLNNLFSICTNSLEKCAVHLLQDTTAVLTLHQTKTTPHPTKEVILLHSGFCFCFCFSQKFQTLLFPEQWFPKFIMWNTNL